MRSRSAPANGDLPGGGVWRAVGEVVTLNIECNFHWIRWIKACCIVCLCVWLIDSWSRSHSPWERTSPTTVQWRTTHLFTEHASSPSPPKIFYTSKRSVTRRNALKTYTEDFLESLQRGKWRIVSQVLLTVSWKNRPYLQCTLIS